MAAEVEPWSRAVPVLGRAALPFGVREPRPGTPPIRQMRAQVMVFGLSLVLILLVLFQLQVTPTEERAVSWPIWLWAALAPASYGACSAFRRSRTSGVVEATDAANALVRYRERLMVCIAFAQAPALVGSAVFFASQTLVPYLVSLPVSLLLMWWVSPRTGDVRDLQEAIGAHGGSLDLAAILMGR